MASVTTKSHQRTQPLLSPLRLDSIFELQENQLSNCMNLGSESPSSILKSSPTLPPELVVDEWANSGLAVNTNVPTRRRSWRSNSWSSTSRSKGMARFQKERFDTDCGVCFEPATNPRKVLCCGQCFCFDHLMEWVSSNKNCPACSTKCSPPISPSEFASRPPITSLKNPPLSTTLPLTSPPTPPPTATTFSFEGYQTQSTIAPESEPLPRSFSPLSSMIIEIFSDRTPALSASLGTLVGDLLIWSALILFISVFIPPVF